MVRVIEEKRRRDKIKEEEETEERGCGCVICRKVAIHCVLRMICGFGRSKSNLAKAAGAEPSGQMRSKKMRAIVVRSRCPS